MKRDRLMLSEFERLNRILEQLAIDLFGFAQICGIGESFRAEQILLDTISRAVECGDLDQIEFEPLYLREKLLTEAWSFLSANIQPASDLSFERFYSLPQKTRAAIYLRHRLGFTFIAIGRVLSLSELQVRNLVLVAREQIVGRPLRKIDWGF